MFQALWRRVGGEVGEVARRGAAEEEDLFLEIRTCSPRLHPALFFFFIPLADCAFQQSGQTGVYQQAIVFVQESERDRERESERER